MHGSEDTDSSRPRRAHTYGGRRQAAWQPAANNQGSGRAGWGGVAASRRLQQPTSSWRWQAGGLSCGTPCLQNGRASAAGLPLPQPCLPRSTFLAILFTWCTCRGGQQGGMFA